MVAGALVSPTCPPRGLAGVIWVELVSEMDLHEFNLRSGRELPISVQNCKTSEGDPNQTGVRGPGQRGAWDREQPRGHTWPAPEIRHREASPSKALCSLGMKHLYQSPMGPGDSERCDGSHLAGLDVGH